MIRKIAILTLPLLLMLFPHALAFKLPDTGQTKCYDQDGALVTCNNTGQDGAYTINQMSYADNHDDTVTDNNTGLTWQSENVHQTFNWYQASGTFNTTYNPSSENVCGSLTLGNHSDWRLPSKKELVSMVDYSISLPGPTINKTYFPNMDAAGYWSSTDYIGTPDSAWYMDFSGGSTAGNDKSSGCYVWCVRGQPPAQGLIDNGNDTVTDLRTGLTWQKQEPSEKKTWSDALSYCEGLSLGNLSDWRLPNIKELESLTDDSRYDPAIDTSLFPDAQSAIYWSSTTVTNNFVSVWHVYLGWGIVYTYGYSKEGNNYLRCVRGGDGGSILPVWIYGTTDYYSTLQGAHDAALDSNKIESLAIVFTEKLNISKFLTLKGGYDGSYSNNNGYTTLHGSLLVASGSLTLENLVIR